jgi:hypothetical protein
MQMSGRRFQSEQSKSGPARASDHERVSRIKMAPARGRAPRPSKVFQFQIARRSSGYPSGAPIEAGKGGKGLSNSEQNAENVELPARAGAALRNVAALLRVESIAPGEIVETSREKVAAPAISSQSTGPFWITRRSTYPEVFGGFFPTVGHDFVAHFRAFIQIA